MAGDIPTAENAVILEALPEPGTVRAVSQAAAEAAGGRIVHRFGPRILITEDPAQVEAEDLTTAAPGVLAGSPLVVPEDTAAALDQTGRLGLNALALRRSEEYIERKRRRPLQGEPWDTDRALAPHPPGEAFGDAAQAASVAIVPAPPVSAPAPPSATSGRVTGSVAVGIVIVEGPTQDLQFSEAERTEVVAEVQNGLTWLATQTPGGPVTWTWDIRVLRVNAPAQPLTAFAAKHSNKWFDIRGGSTGLGAELIQWDWNGGHNQHFSVEPLGDGTVRLVAEHSGRVLDVEGASTASGARIIQWDWHGGDNQRFRLEDLGGGEFRLVASHSGRVLDVEGGSTASGARLIQWDWHGGDNQRFTQNRLAEEREARWRDPALVSMGYGGGLGGVTAYVNDLRRNLGTQWGYCGFFTKYPLWWFAYASIGGPRIIMDYANDGWGPANIDRVFAHETGHIFGAPDEYSASNCDCWGRWGYYQGPNINCERCAPGGGVMCLMRGNDWSICEPTTAQFGWTSAWALGVPIMAKHSGRALDIWGASTGNGAELIQWDWHDNLNQRFRLDSLEDGTYRLAPRHSGKVLDVAGASMASGARLIQWDWHGEANQRFWLEPAGGGDYRLVASHSDKVLDVEGGSTASGARLIQWDWHGGDNQRFRFPGWPVVARHSGKVADVSGASPDNGAAFIQWDHHGGGNQLLRVEPLGRGEYRLVAEHSGKVLDVEGASTVSGARLIQWDWHGGDNQRFRLEPVGNGYVRIVAKHSGRVVDVSGASTTAGAQLIQWDWHGGANQRWRILGALITARHSGQVLDVSGASTDSGARIIQWPRHSGDNQRIRLEPVGGGFYRLAVEHSGKVLDIAGAATGNGAELIQWHWNGGDNQRFRLEPAGGRLFRIVAKHSGRVLDVSGASTAAGARLIQWDWHGGNNQRFRL